MATGIDDPKRGTCFFIGRQYMTASGRYTRDSISLYTTLPDDTEIAVAGKDQSAVDWPKVTLGEIRAWVAEKARQQAAIKDFVALPGVAEHIVEAAARREAEGLPPRDSLGTTAEGGGTLDAPPPPLVEAAAPGPIGGDYVTGVGIQTPAPSFQPIVDDPAFF